MQVRDFLACSVHCYVSQLYVYPVIRPPITGGALGPGVTCCVRTVCCWTVRVSFCGTWSVGCWKLSLYWSHHHQSCGESLLWFDQPGFSYCQSRRQVHGESDHQAVRHKEELYESLQPVNARPHRLLRTDSLARGSGCNPSNIDKGRHPGAVLLQGGESED